MRHFLPQFEPAPGTASLGFDMACALLYNGCADIAWSNCSATGRTFSRAMKIDSSRGTARNAFAGQGGFTMIEVAFAAAIAALVLAGMFQGYNLASRRAQFSACSLAASTSAMHQMERVISAGWSPSAGTSNLLTLGGTVVSSLDLPSAANNFVNCTNVITVSQVSSSPAYAMIEVDCIWTFPSYGGVYTNTVATLRAPY